MSTCPAGHPAASKTTPSAAAAQPRADPAIVGGRGAKPALGASHDPDEPRSGVDDAAHDQEAAEHGAEDDGDPAAVRREPAVDAVHAFDGRLRSEDEPEERDLGEHEHDQ